MLSAPEEPLVVWWENRSGEYDYDIYFATSGAPSAADLTYRWDFGDGFVAEGIEVEHLYSAPGEYVVTLTVSDAERGSDTDTATVRVVEDPAVLLDELREAVAILPDGAFKPAGNSAPHRRQALLNKVDALASLVAAEAFGEALEKLREDLIAKWDGCGAGHSRNDWVIDCEAQARLQAIGDRIAQSLEVLGDR